MMRLPVRIFSDVHLGHRASRVADAEAFRPLIRGAGTVIFNGDTWEELADPWREKSRRLLEDLKMIIAEEGCDSVFLPGNHDPGCGVPGYVTLADGQVVITHGDALLWASSPWKHEILASSAIISEIWNHHPDAESNLDSRLNVAREIAIRLSSHEFPKSRHFLSRALDAAFPPKRALSMLSAWINQGRHGAEFCEKYFPKAKYLIIGHFHCAAVRHSGGRTIINTGSFVIPGPARWASWDGKSLATGKVCERHGKCSIGRETRTWELFQKPLT